MIGEPFNSQYDLNFVLFGYRVRVTWLFWIVTAAFGYSNCIFLDERIFGERSPGAFVLLVIWVAAVFLSILVHELGHTVAMKYYNIDSHIVLYHLGGLAIPYGFRQHRPGAPRRNGYGPQAQLIISLAGPVAQLALGALFIAFAIGLGYYFSFANWFEWLGMDLGNLRSPRDPTVEPALYAAIDFVIYPSIAWALLNLLPVLPLDGGRIAQHLLTIFQKRDGLHEAAILSIVVGVLVGMWGFQNDRQFLGIMFLMLAFSNFQNMRGNMGGF